MPQTTNYDFILQECFIDITNILEKYECELIIEPSGVIGLRRISGLTQKDIDAMLELKGISHAR